MGGWRLGNGCRLLFVGVSRDGLGGGEENGERRTGDCSCGLLGVGVDARLAHGERLLRRDIERKVPLVGEGYAL